MAESVFLSPKSIAVIGASDKAGSVGATITSNIMNGFTGVVYPISPSRDKVFSKKAYKTVLDVPKQIGRRYKDPLPKGGIKSALSFTVEVTASIK